jgi:NAD+ diphosphatase
VWAVDVPHGEDPSYGAAIDLYTYYGRTSERWSGRSPAAPCSSPSGPAPIGSAAAAARRRCRPDNDRSMKCPACGLLAYPRLAPAMITLVTRGAPGPTSEALLARGVQFRAPMYSCLAGFVEAGESLEQSRGARGARGGRVQIGTSRYAAASRGRSRTA